MNFNVALYKANQQNSSVKLYVINIDIFIDDANYTCGIILELPKLSTVSILTFNKQNAHDESPGNCS